MRRPNLALWTMTAVSFGTGALDAATYLGMDGVFGANMTGNVILIALSIAGEGVHPFIGPAMALGGFITGSWLLGLTARRYPKDSTPDPVVAPVFAVCAVGLLTITTVLLWLPMTGTLLHTATFTIGLLMGFQALAARRVGVPDISTVVITSTLSLLFGEAGRFRGGASRIATGRRTAAVLSMFLGAVSGALLLKIGLMVALLLPTTILTAVAIIYTTRAVVLRKRLRQATQPKEFVDA
ncbi:YoaK family protein [Rhodococcus sp. T2V]|uniref:YoaK family protein n=1 Tax=Rhodococcus sp. T2V TaxID=3034164 RepID=UPI0023E0ACB4|nr:YoaK family protein [Rhodococcus sp. T2V]MDF3306829.1 YoaK family protein [Rhodococcus sp. T2V]